MSGGHTPATGARKPARRAAPVAGDDRSLHAGPGHGRGRVVGAARGVFGLAAAARDGDTCACAIAADLGRSADAADSVDFPAGRCGHAAQAAVGGGGARQGLRRSAERCDRRRRAPRLSRGVRAPRAHEALYHPWHGDRPGPHRRTRRRGGTGAGSRRAAVAGRAAQAAPVSRNRFRSRRSRAAKSREHFKPKRRLPLHDWHESAGATFVPTGLWLRPLVYSRRPGWEPVLDEARAVRAGVGITDVSTLGKIDVQGPDAARFLDFIYANTFSTLAVGRARYGIMLREDGMMLDDGTTSRLGPEHFLVTTTTAGGTACARAHGVPPAGACAASSTCC